MKKTGFLYDERFLSHNTGPFHPETPDRLPAILDGIQGTKFYKDLIMVSASPADMKWVQTVHDKAYIDRFENACCCNSSVFDCPDNIMCGDTFNTALLAVGGVLNMVRLVMDGQLDNGFCAVRPPGHHAETGEAMGFCYFNNIAVAAQFLRIEYGLQRVGIVDFDVHHGNGTQHIFEADPSVFYYSIHQHPSFAYPGTGREFEVGSGAGQGFTKNSPVLPGSGDDVYKDMINKDLVPVFDEFKPEMILVSAGFDAHIDDDMSDMKLTTQGFSWIMGEVTKLAEKYAQGRIVSILEGGYSLKRLPELAKNHIESLLGD